MCPPTTAPNPLPIAGMGSCMRRLSSAFTSPSFACNRWRIVCRSTVNRPLTLVLPQMCVKPRKAKVSGFPAPRRWRLSAAYRPNSTSRVLSGCSSSRNLRKRCASSSRNRSASDLYWNPSTMSSANLTTIMSPRACWRRHARVQPFLDEPHHAPVRTPVLDKLDHPTVVDGIEEATDVEVEHPVHLLRH